jgi:Uma2 family endonuclease
MTTEVSEKLYTVNEFLALDLPDDVEYELIGGRIVARQGITSGKHADIVGRVSTILNNFAGFNAGEKRTGTVFSGGSTNLGNPGGKNYPKPDVCFVLNDRLPPDFEDEIPVAPDLAVEVNSPSDTEERKFEKLQAYRQAGVKLIWSIHMLEKYILVYRAGRQYPDFLTPDDELDGGEVLPGFRLAVKDLFS